MVKLWVANTDLEWFDYLYSKENIDEVNFWQPSGNANFGAVQRGELFLFKLKSPRNVIGGFGVFDRAYNLPLSLAWEAFQTKNGARSLIEMRSHVGRYRRDEVLANDYTIGCRVVVQPTFLPENLWIPQPETWANSIMAGKTYDTSDGEGLALWERVAAVSEKIKQAPTNNLYSVAEESAIFVGPSARFGEPRLIKPRLGQGAFRLAVTDAYGRQCAISGGKVLPALEAAHVRAYGEGGEHAVENGILLRRDIHSVFDAGYVTFDERLRMVVSDRVRTDFNNGNEYRRLHGSPLSAPTSGHPKIDPRNMLWHRENIFLG